MQACKLWLATAEWANAATLWPAGRQGQSNRDSPHLKTDDAAKAMHLLHGDAVVGVAGQAGVVHAGNAGVILQAPRNLKGL